jgi:hypothetical protein
MMSAVMPVEDIISDDLTKLLKQLHLGETITLVNADGQPLAILVGVSSASEQPSPTSDWRARWEDLARRVGQAWKTEQSAIDTLTEMRR